jgi:DNA-binding transcriptional regulator GbsR (MarR family)
MISFRLIILNYIKKHREIQANKIRFLQVRIPKNAVSKNSDIDATDHAQTMKNNIEIMNQVYKNFYAIHEDGRKFRKLGNNYISMEILVEKEMIKFIIGVPEDHLETVEKMIASFYV